MQKNSFLWIAAAAVAVTGGISTALATTLTAVPMQGGMVMPMVAYHASDGGLHVMVPTETPQLTPLLVSNPSDHFDPNDPWFEMLDSSAQGRSFSRRYGFMMDANSDLLPTGTQMWIRKLSSSPDLQFYSASSSPNRFRPIFGTDGATNALSWDGVMFHPVVAAPPGTNDFIAIFEIYLVDNSTGEEVPNSSSAPFELDWTDVSDGRPTLTLSLGQPQNTIVSWPPDTTTNWVLESAESLNLTGWTIVTNAPITMNGRPSVILDDSAMQQYFRMRYVP